MARKTKVKKIKATDFVPGRVYSVIYGADVEMVGKREFDNLTPELAALPFDRCANGAASTKKLNPLADMAVSVRRVSTVQAAGNETWNNFKAKNEIETESNRAPWYTVSEQNDCIVVHNTNGTEYLRGLPRGITKEEYFVGDVPATTEQVALIRAFKKSKGDINEPRAFVVLKLDNLQNVSPLPA